MKYLRYLYILLDKIKGKIIGVVVFYLLSHRRIRAYARNRVYNYVLQNNVYLPRLIERKWTLDTETMCYYPVNKSKKAFILKNRAYIKYRKVSKIEYFFAFRLWRWFDDDSNYDTHDGIETDETIDKPFGNAFDIGDLRAEYPIINGMKTFKWICRNSYYNANYMLEEIRENSKYNFYKQIKIFGFITHWGFIPYSNSQRKGRLVYWREDLDKIDKELLK